MRGVERRERTGSGSDEKPFQAGGRLTLLLTLPPLLMPPSKMTRLLRCRRPDPAHLKWQLCETRKEEMRTGPIDRSFWVGVSEAGDVCWPGKRTRPVDSTTGEVVVTRAQK